MVAHRLGLDAPAQPNCAAFLGFSSQSAFAHWFRCRFGCGVNRPLKRFPHISTKIHKKSFKS